MFDAERKREEAALEQFKKISKDDLEIFAGQPARRRVPAVSPLPLHLPPRPPAPRRRRRDGGDVVRALRDDGSGDGRR